MELEESFLIQNQLSELGNEINSTKNDLINQKEDLQGLKVLISLL